MQEVAYNFNWVFDTYEPLIELFTMFVDGKVSKLKYIPSDYSKSVDRFIPMQSRTYTTTTSPYDMLEDGEPYTYLDLHKTITDSYD